MRHNPTPAILPGYKSSQALPARYDLRDSSFVTSVKNQGGGAAGGNCTMFATMGALESRWLKTAFDSLDLSEQNLAACHGYEWDYGEGANSYICSAYLSRFSGPVLETQDPYNTLVTSCTTLEPFALVPEARWLPGRDFHLLKEVIYYYGAVWVSVHIDMTKFNDTVDTYYYDGNAPSNHAFLACGWDDAKVTAGGTGAWIVKNSWGPGWADNGFVYVSYNDTKFAGEMALFPTRWDTDEVDSLYMYDHLSFDSLLWALGDNELYELAKFETPGEQLLTRVGLVAFNPVDGNDNSIFDIEIYDDFTDGTLSGLLASRKDILATVNGRYTFEIPVVVNGDFYVKVKRTTDYSDGFIPIEAMDAGYADPLIEQDVNWISTDGKNWVSANDGTTHFGTLFTKGFNLTIRAYTSYDTGPTALFTASKTISCINSSVDFSYVGNGAATSYTWDFGSGASPASASTPGPHAVTYSTVGTKTISLIIENSGDKDTLVRHDYVNIHSSDNYAIILPSPQVRIIPGDSLEISVYGADEYIWTPSTILSSNQGSKVYAKPPSENEYVITIYGEQGDCSAQTNLTILSYIPPDNDDVCNAQLITPVGLVGTVTNEKATVQPGEPAPDPISCYTDSTWCANEPGAMHTVWYYFYGPATGFATIRTGGLGGWDNQIAVYRADTCINVKKNSLVWANDDQSATIYPAKLDMTLTPGAKYFLQLDGSGNSQEGSCDLYFYDAPVGLESIVGGDADADLSVYPNPTRDVFNVRLRDLKSGQLTLYLYNMNGQLVVRNTFRNLSDEFHTSLDMSDFADGMYHLRLIDGDRVIHRKIIKE